MIIERQVIINSIIKNDEPCAKTSRYVLKYLLEGNSSVVVRPSGTEPKLKVYISISAASMDKARAVEKQIAEQIEQYMK